MENLNDPRNIIGMSDILADDDDDELDIDEIEKSIVNGVSYTKKETKQVDLAKEYDKELDQLTRQFGIDSGSSGSGFGMSGSSKPSVPDVSGGFGKSPFDADDADDDQDDQDDDQNQNDQPQTKWSAAAPRDSQLQRMTTEERKQNHINQVLGSIDKAGDETPFLQQEEEEDEMARIMEQIDLLKTNLESEGIDLSRIPDVGVNTSKKDAKAVLRILQIKNDRLRYCDMFEEGILAMAYGLESAFDGKKNWFGTQIDLTGWSETVKVKLRRMRYDTSSFVSEVMKGYNLGSGWRILFELLPSLFLYSRDRRLKANDNLISDDRYKEAINNLGSK